MLYNDLRIYRKIVAGCGMCPSLYEHIGVFFCEKTGLEYDGTKAYNDNCPLYYARTNHSLNGVTEEEKYMLTASYTADITDNEKGESN